MRREERDNEDKVDGSVEIEGEIYSAEEKEEQTRETGPQCNHRLYFHFHLVDNCISVCIRHSLLIAIQNKNAMSFRILLMLQGLRGNLEIPHLTCHNSSRD